MNGCDFASFPEAGFIVRRGSHDPLRQGRASEAQNTRQGRRAAPVHPQDQNGSPASGVKVAFGWHREVLCQLISGIILPGPPPIERPPYPFTKASGRMYVSQLGRPGAGPLARLENPRADICVSHAKGCCHFEA